MPAPAIPLDSAARWQQSYQGEGSQSIQLYIHCGVAVAEFTVMLVKARSKKMTSQLAAVEQKQTCPPDLLSLQVIESQSFRTALACSHGAKGDSGLPKSTKGWLGGLAAQLPKHFWVHQDAAAKQAARLLGAEAFALGNRIFVGDVPVKRIEHVIRHELVHLAQVQLALQSGQVTTRMGVEDEAETIARLPVAAPVRCGAHPNQPYCFIPIVIAIGFGLYILLRPSPANAPGVGDKVLPRVSEGQIIGEGLAIFVVPGGALKLAGRIGLGFFGSSMVAGAASTTSMRAVGDLAKGEASPPLLYLTDAATGAVIGFVVPGGFRLIGRAGTFAFDRLATLGMREADIKLTSVLAQQAAIAPLNAAQAQQILMQRGLAGQVAQWYLNKRGLIVLYRGQELETPQILSPLAQNQDVAASQALLAKIKALGYSDVDIASYSARYHTELFDKLGDPPDLYKLSPGSIGIPATGIPGIASGFGKEAGVVYLIRIPRNAVIRPEGWPLLKLEDEYTIFNQIPKGSIIQIIPASRIPALTVDGNGLLAPATR